MDSGKAAKAVIAPMALEHIPEIARLESVCFSQPWSRQGLEEELTNPTARFFVALWDGKTAGYAGMHGVCGEGYIANIAVLSLIHICNLRLSASLLLETICWIL